MDTTTIPDHHEAARREALPSSRYDGATTSAEVDRRYREAYHAAQKEHGRYGVPYALQTDLSEDARRAHARIVRGEPTPRVDRATRDALTVATVVEHPDGSTTITCQGPCGETMPLRKFPTLSGRPGVRGNVCRACRAAKKGA